MSDRSKPLRPAWAARGDWVSRSFSNSWWGSLPRDLRASFKVRLVQCWTDSNDPNAPGRFMSTAIVLHATASGLCSLLAEPLRSMHFLYCSFGGGALCLQESNSNSRRLLPSDWSPSVRPNAGTTWRMVPQQPVAMTSGQGDRTSWNASSWCAAGTWRKSRLEATRF